MKKLHYLLICASILFSSCTYLPFLKFNSTTLIKAHDTFILGNNEHGKFDVKLKNISNSDVTVWQAPISGGRHSPLIVQANQKVQIRVDRNTALNIENNSDKTVSVELVIQGDTGLSMGYLK
ncbi:MAG: hypothetical protein RJA04_1431 [Bacteroidota bacterium]